MRTGRAAAVLGLGLLALAGSLVIAPSHSAVHATLDVASVALPALGALVALPAARAAHGRARTGLIVLTAGLAAATLAEAIWAGRDLFAATLSIPSPADAAYLGFLLAVAVGVLLLPAGDRNYQLPARLVLDGVVMAASLFLVSWVTVIRGLVRDGSATGLSLATILAYPILNLVALTVTAVTLARSGSGQRVMLSLLTAGLFTMTLAETVFVRLSLNAPFTGHHLVELMWLTGMGLILLAAVSAADARFGTRGAEAPGWASVWLPYAPFMLAAVVLAPQPRDVVLGAPVVLTAALLLPAVLVRQYLAVAENRRLVAAVAEQALHDPLTGLPNRALFAERLEQTMATADRAGAPVGVLMLDLDDFKLVNDTLGHACGDELLIAAAGRLSAAAGDGSTVARLGGDEFAAVVTGPDDALRDTADRVRLGFAEPFRVDGHEVRIRPTIGLAIARAGGLSAADLVKQADAAMYAGKRANTAAAQDVGAATRAAGRSGADSGALRTLGELRAAVEHGELDLVYRPQADLRTGRVVGVEALLRWPHPQRGTLLPEQFLPLVRQNGLIDPVTDFVIQRALDDAAEWRRAGAALAVAVNLFAPCLQDRALPARVGRLLSRCALRPQALTLEITEDLPISHGGHAAEVLGALREQGIRIAVDDFGSGYSTLADLCRLPVDEIKLDDTLIGVVLTDAKAAAVVRSVAALAGELGLSTVAEGVRDARMARTLLDYGCDLAQGDYIGPALAAADLPEFLRGARPAAPEAAGRVAP